MAKWNDWQLATMAKTFLCLARSPNMGSTLQNGRTGDGTIALLIFLQVNISLSQRLTLVTSLTFISFHVMICEQEQNNLFKTTFCSLTINCDIAIFDRLEFDAHKLFQDWSLWFAHARNLWLYMPLNSLFKLEWYKYTVRTCLCILIC